MASHKNKNKRANAKRDPFPSTLKDCTHPENSYDNLQLVFSEGEVVGDLLQTVDGVEANRFNLVIEHVHEEILRLNRKAR